MIQKDYFGSIESGTSAGKHIYQSDIKPNHILSADTDEMRYDPDQADMLVCTFIWYRTQFMNYILLGVAEFMLVGVLAAGAFILAPVTGNIAV